MEGYATKVNSPRRKPSSRKGSDGERDTSLDDEEVSPTGPSVKSSKSKQSEGEERSDNGCRRLGDPKEPEKEDRRGVSDGEGGEEGRETNSRETRGKFVRLVPVRKEENHIGN